MTGFMKQVEVGKLFRVGSERPSRISPGKRERGDGEARRTLGIEPEP